MFFRADRMGVVGIRFYRTANGPVQPENDHAPFPEKWKLPDRRRAEAGSDGALQCYRTVRSNV